MVETEGGAPGELPQISVAKPPRRKRIRQKKDKTVSRFQAGGKGAPARRQGGEVSAYDFFTRTWDEEEQIQPAMATQEEEATGDALMAILSPGRRRSDVTVPRQARIVNTSANTLLFVPTSKAASQDVENLDEEKAHDPVVDGLYVGNPPQTKSWNRNKMAQRLLASGDSQFLDGRGGVISVTDAIAELDIRPLHEQESKPSALVETAFYPPREIDSMQLARKFGDSGLEVTTFRLDLDIHSLIFTHHPLYNREQFLAQKLREAFKEHKTTLENSPVHRLNRKITALFDSIQGLRPSAFSEERSRLYKHLLNLSLKERDLAHEKQRKALKKTLALWKAVKAERESTGFVSSTIRIEVQVEPVQDVDEKQREAEEQIAQEFEIIKHNFEETHSEQAKTYRQARREWRRHHELRAEARRRQDRRLENEDVTDDDEDLRASDMALLSVEEGPQPQAPDELNDTQLLIDLRRKRTELQGQVDEPRMFLCLHEDASLSANHDIKVRQEINRRHALDRGRIALNVLLNRKTVHSTPAAGIHATSYSVKFQEKVNMVLLSPPSQLMLEITEKGGIRETRLAQVELPFPSTEQGDEITLETFSFSSSKHFARTNNSMGAGEEVTVIEDWQDVPNVEGKVTVSMSWGKDEAGHIQAPPIAGRGQRRQSTVDALNDTTPPKGWPAGSQVSELDPLDPRNASLFSVLKSLSSGEASMLSSCFRLGDEELSIQDPLDNPRFKVLQLRDAGIPRFRNLHMVPNNLDINSSDPAAEALRIYEKREQTGSISSGGPRYSVSYGSSGRLKEHESRLRALKKGLQDWIYARLEAAQSKKTLADVVMEESVPDISVMGKKLLHLFAPYRPLRPERVERKKLNIQHAVLPEISLVITVLKAINVPVRSEISSNTTTDEEDAQLSVAPFIEVTYDRQSARTVTAEGSTPTWNQPLTLPFLSSNWDTFTESNDTILLNLFDEIALDVLEDARERGRTIHKKLVRQWLGSLRLPVATLLSHPKVEGTFPVETPPVLLGYEWDRSSSVTRPPTLLSLYVTSDPPVYAPEATIVERLPSNELPTIVTASSRWKESYQTRFPKRHVSTLVMDVNCRAVFITRFARPLAPPAELEKEETTLARFVSLIPYIPDANLGASNCDVWVNNEQFLAMLGGDEEEHATLLLGYFLDLKLDAWLLVGEDRGGRHATFVATRGKGLGEYFLWLPTTGERWSLNDPFLPISQVWYAVNAENVWVNIHKDAPDRTTLPPLDFENTAHWEAFFGKLHAPLSSPLPSVQPAEIDYTPPDTRLAEELQRLIETTVKEHFMNWRRRERTTWNRHCTSLLRTLLPGLEKHGSAGSKVEEHLTQLREILVGYRVIGFPLNFSYQSMEKLLDGIHATNLHSHEGREVEFSIAVHVHPYPCGVMSVWVYIACLRLRD